MIKFNAAELNNIESVVKDNSDVIFLPGSKTAWSKVILNLIEQVRLLTKEKDWRMR